MSARVLLLSGWYGPFSYGGTESYVSWLAGDLQGLGIEVAVAFPSRASYHERPGGIQTIGYDAAGGAGRESFQAVLERVRPDIVHFHSYTGGCGPVQAEAVAAAGLPYVVTMHTPGWNCARGTMRLWGRRACDGRMDDHRCAACYLQGRGMPLPFAAASAFASNLTGRIASGRAGSAATALSITRRMRERRSAAQGFVGKARKVVVVCEWLRGVLQLNGVPAAKITLCRHGLPPRPAPEADARPPRRAGAIEIAYVGRICDAKGIDVLVRAFRHAFPGGQERLSVYGGAQNDQDRAFERRLHELARGDDRVVFRGPVAEAGVSSVLAAADAVAIPSVWMETGPLVALEAFAARRPVLGSDLGGIPELVRHEVSGLTAAPGNIPAWTRMLARLREEPGLLPRLSAGIPPVRTSRQVASETLGIYAEALGRALP